MERNPPRWQSEAINWLTDKDEASGAWKQAPSDYHASREKDFAVPRDPASVYVTMRDGCRLAVDVYLPQAEKSAGRKFPAILIFTPYYRRFKLSEPGADPRRMRPSTATL